MKTRTCFNGTMAEATKRRVKSIAAQLRLTEAQAVEWAVKRCGLRIRIPSKFFPES